MRTLAWEHSVWTGQWKASWREGRTFPTSASQSSPKDWRSHALNRRFGEGRKCKRLGQEELRLESGSSGLTLALPLAGCVVPGAFELQVPPVQNGDNPSFSPESLRI